METKKIARFRFTALAHTFDSWDEVISYYERLVECGECMVKRMVKLSLQKLKNRRYDNDYNYQ